METCIACSSIATASVKDGCFIKPVCRQHANFYGAQGYIILPLSKAL